MCSAGTMGKTSRWPLTEVKELEVRHYVGTVALSAVFVDDTELILLRGSLGNRSFYQDFAQTVNAQIKGTEAELREHRQDQLPQVQSSLSRSGTAHLSQMLG